MPAGFTSRLQTPTAADQINDQDDHGDDEQDVNVGAERVEADEAEQPQNEQNDKDGPKHERVSS
jgi:hypothetical protein